MGLTFYLLALDIFFIICIIKKILKKEQYMILRIKSDDKERALNLGIYNMMCFKTYHSLISEIKFMPGAFPIDLTGEEFVYFLLPIGLMCVKNKKNTDEKLSDFIITNWFNLSAEKVISQNDNEIKFITLSTAPQSVITQS